MRLVSPSEVPLIWQKVLPGIERAMVYSDSIYAGEDFYKDLVSGFSDLWVIEEEGEVIAHSITQILRYPRMTFLRILTAEGKSKGMPFYIYDHLPDIEEYAKSQGCEFIEAPTRKGMARVLEKHGWKLQYTIVTKRIENERISEKPGTVTG
jgi:hypothetical protein